MCISFETPTPDLTMAPRETKWLYCNQYFTALDERAPIVGAVHTQTVQVVAVDNIMLKLSTASGRCQIQILAGFLRHTMLSPQKSTRPLHLRLLLSDLEARMYTYIHIIVERPLACTVFPSPMSSPSRQRPRCARPRRTPSRWKGNSRCQMSRGMLASRCSTSAGSAA